MVLLWDGCGLSALSGDALLRSLEELELWDMIGRCTLAFSSVGGFSCPVLLARRFGRPGLILYDPASVSSELDMVSLFGIVFVLGLSHNHESLPSDPLRNMRENLHISVGCRH